LKARYRQQAVSCPNEFLYKALEICNQCELSFKASRNQRLHVELALIRLCNISYEKKNLIHELPALEIPELNKSHQINTPVEQIPVKVLQSVEKPVIIRESAQPYEAAPKISIKDALMDAERGTHTNDHGSEKKTEAANSTSPISDALKPLSEEFLTLCWNSYAGQIREDKPRMAVTLKKVQPQIMPDYIIAVALNNRSQLEDFNNSTKADLEKFLQCEMHNNRITVEASLLDSPDAPQAKLYTNEEKYRYLSQKNPVLASFRQKLNLELD
jgi:DNA polymerase-3 subunit gamma/tau